VICLLLMDTVLHRETFIITGNDFEHGGQAAAAVKAIMREFGLDPAIIRRLSIANFEAEMNVIMYADQAQLEFVVQPDQIRVTLTDRGQGIPDIDEAMQEGFSTATAEMRARGFGAGMGLPNIKRSTDWFEIESTPGTGTTLRYGVYLVPAGEGRP
jgi:serine/threonine-protein kinase RsbT